MEWAHPAWLWLLLLLPAYAIWEWRGGGGALVVPRSGAVGAEARARILGSLPLVLRTGTLALLILALARPRGVDAVVQERTEGIPMVVAMDVSSSMLAQDFRPRDRLAVAKATVAEFIAARPDDPIGLVAFAAEALTLVPITTYEPVLLSALGALQVGLLEDGTAIGEGLATAVNRLRRAPGETKVVILMSDGESNRGEVEPLAAARAAAAFGIRVYTIGVGSEGVARVPVRRAPEGFRYAERPVAIDETLLREIADITGGAYYRATNPGALRRIYERIDRLVKSPIETIRRVQYREWYPWLLLAAAVLLAAEWTLRGSRWGAVP